METNLNEIRNDLKRELTNVDTETKENNSAPQVQEDFISLDTAKLLMQCKDGLTSSLVSKGASENAVILIRDTLKTSDEDVIRYRRVIQNYIRAKFPHWVERLQKVTDNDMALLLISELMKLGAALNIRHEDKQARENPTALSKFWDFLRNVLFFAKKPEVKKITE